MKFRTDAHTNTIHARTKFGIKTRRRRDAPCREKMHLSKAVKSYLTFVMATHTPARAVAPTRAKEGERILVCFSHVPSSFE